MTDDAYCPLCFVPVTHHERGTYCGNPNCRQQWIRWTPGPALGEMPPQEPREAAQEPPAADPSPGVASTPAAQTRAVLEHLRGGGKLTALDALASYGIGRLAARVYDLREQGHVINKSMVKVQKRDGTWTRVAQYSTGTS